MGGQNLTSAGFNQYIADVIIALIIYFAGFSKLFRDILSRRKARVRTAAPQPTLGEKAALVNPAAAETVKEEADLKAPPEEAVEETAGEIAGEAAEEITEKTEQVSFEENEGKESKA